MGSADSVSADAQFPVGNQYSGVGTASTTGLSSTNLGFDDLRARMAAFTVKFDAFIERGNKKILDERSEFARNMAEDRGELPCPHLEVKESLLSTKSRTSYY